MDGLNTYGDLWESDELADVIFIVGEEPVTWRIAAHKLVLSKSNVVFYDLFNGKEKNEPCSSTNEEIPESTETTSEKLNSISRKETKEVESKEDVFHISLIRPDIFNQLLRFLYLNEIEIDSIESAITLHQAAHIYEVKEVVKRCIKYLAGHLIPKNLFYIYLCMEEYMDEEESLPLQGRCVQLIDEKTDEVLNTNGFLNLSQECINDISSRNALHISSEVFLLEGLLRWSAAECKRKHLKVTFENQRKVLGNALFNVRFGLITEDYVTQLLKKELLKNEDKKKFIRVPRIKGFIASCFSVPISDSSMNESEIYSFFFSFISERKVFLTSIIIKDPAIVFVPIDYFNGYNDFTDIPRVINEINYIKVFQSGREIIQQCDHSLWIYKHTQNNEILIEFSDPVCVRPKEKFNVHIGVMLKDSDDRNIMTYEEINPIISWNDGRKSFHIICKSSAQYNSVPEFGQILQFYFHLSISDDQNISNLDRGRRLWVALKWKLKLTDMQIKQQWKKVFNKQ